MVVNPADLSGPSAMSNRDSPHSNTILYNYDTEPGNPVGGRGVGSPTLRTGGESGQGIGFVMLNEESGEGGSAVPGGS